MLKMVKELDELYLKLNGNLAQKEEVLVLSQIGELREDIKAVEKNINDETRKNTFKAVYGVPTQEVLELFRADYKAIKNDEEALAKARNLFQKYVLAITFLYSAPSIKNNLGAFRKVVNEEGGIWKETVKSSFYIFDVYKAVSEVSEQKLKEKEEAQKSLTFEIKTEIERTKSILEDRTYKIARNQSEQQVRVYYISYLQALAGGRRFAEILKTAKIYKKGAGHVFKGILKKDRSDKTEVEANLLYVSVDEYKAYTKELRNYIELRVKSSKDKALKDITEQELNLMFSKVFNGAIKRITDDKVPNFHELRHYYAIEGTRVFRAENESDKDVRYRILGHHIKADTTRTYKTIK